MDFLHGFNWFDLALLLVVLLLGVKGFINGLMREVFGLVGLIGGIIIAARFNTKAGSLISEHIYKFEKSAMADAVGFIALFIGFWLLCIFLGALMRRLVGLSGLGFVDRLGGFIAGGAKVFLILSALLAVLMRMNFIGEVIKPVIGNSTAYTMLLNTGAWVLNLDVNDINKKINEHLDTEKNNTKELDNNTSDNIDKTTLENSEIKPENQPEVDESKQMQTDLTVQNKELENSENNDQNRQ